MCHYHAGVMPWSDNPYYQFLYNPYIVTNIYIMEADTSPFKKSLVFSVQIKSKGHASPVAWMYLTCPAHCDLVTYSPSSTNMFLGRTVAK